MINIKNKSKCTGCHACANICPRQCISMKADAEGFLYPVVNNEKCIACGLCNKVCHIETPPKMGNISTAFVGYNLDNDTRITSSSGGLFTLFAERILEMGGVVFGAAFDENLEVKHFYIECKEDMSKLRGSKYVQSIIGDAYKQAKEFLEDGRALLFTGTPCQISGLISYLGKDYENLYTQDIICHGVPSGNLWKKYIEYLEKQYNSKINIMQYPSFRAKTFGWLNYSIKMHLKNNMVYDKKHRNDLFMRIFLSNALLRPSCYKCHCKDVVKNSDITLADFWGVDRIAPEMFDDKGTSIILINTDKGKFLFDEIKHKCMYKEIGVCDALRYNPAAYMSSPRPLVRRNVVRDMENLDFAELQQRCEKRIFVEKVYYKIKRVIKYKKIRKYFK